MNQPQAVKASPPSPQLGVFLCECGSRIVPKVDPAVLAQLLNEPPGIAHVEILPFSCLRPGLERIKEVVAAKGLNRLIVAGCESRILHKKFEQALEALGLAETQIDMVNLRDHVAQVHSARARRTGPKGGQAHPGLPGLARDPRTGAPHPDRLSGAGHGLGRGRRRLRRGPGTGGPGRGHPPAPQLRPGGGNASAPAGSTWGNTTPMTAWSASSRKSRPAPWSTRPGLGLCSRSPASSATTP